MCGRFTLTTPDYSKLAAELGAEPRPEFAEQYRPRFNIAPTNSHWIFCVEQGQRSLLPARWGLIPRWAKPEKLPTPQINARSETAAEKPMFRDAFRKRRCIVPADGFYEWQKTAGPKKPFWIHPRKAGLLRMAGLFEDWLDPKTQTPLRTFTILTTSANSALRSIHDRMPVILSKPQGDRWISVDESAETLTQLLAPASDDLLATTEISTRVNSVKNDDPSILAEVRP